ncbi:unnamed protein product [Rotaria sordida]|uniref:Peptidase M12A domain-containing protein n=1 Tax=Rotaria sordida TaxID=392033 RepID=A0A814WD00_9BILA|nr:unnamed protein product [Rotaria sordida]
MKSTKYKFIIIIGIDQRHHIIKQDQVYKMTIIYSLILIVFTLAINLHGIPIEKDSFQRQRSFEEIGGYFQGDIRIPQLTRSVAVVGDYVRWPGGVVPYTISSDYSTADRNIIINAMRTLESLAAVNNVLCVQFRDKIDSDGQYYIMIQNGVGCSAYVGRYTGVTFDRIVTLQNPGCLDTATIMHELMHVLGNTIRLFFILIVCLNMEKSLEGLRNFFA